MVLAPAARAGGSAHGRPRVHLQCPPSQSPMPTSVGPLCLCLLCRTSPPTMSQPRRRVHRANHGRTLQHRCCPRHRWAATGLLQRRRWNRQPTQWHAAVPPGGTEALAPSRRHWTATMSQTQRLRLRVVSARDHPNRASGGKCRAAARAPSQRLRPPSKLTTVARRVRVQWAGALGVALGVALRDRACRPARMPMARAEFTAGQGPRQSLVLRV